MNSNPSVTSENDTCEMLQVSLDAGIEVPISQN